MVLRAIGCSRFLNSFALPGVLVGVCLLEGVCFPPSITSWRRQLREKVPLVDPLCMPFRPLRSSFNFFGHKSGRWGLALYASMSDGERMMMGRKKGRGTEAVYFLAASPNVPRSPCGQGVPPEHGA